MKYLKNVLRLKWTKKQLPYPTNDVYAERLLFVETIGRAIRDLNHANPKFRHSARMWLLGLVEDPVLSADDCAELGGVEVALEYVRRLLNDDDHVKLVQVANFMAHDKDRERWGRYD